MTLERAVEILNERKHRALEDWRLEYGVDWTRTYHLQTSFDYDTFVTIAIAEKYERDGH